MLMSEPSHAGPATYRGLGLVIDQAKLRGARERLQREGLSIAQWAAQHGYSYKRVHEVLSGRKPCTRGKNNEIARKLGLIGGDA